MTRRTWASIALGAALSSCSSGGDPRTPDPVSSDEARALSQAAEMLDERPREQASVADAENADE